MSCKDYFTYEQSLDGVWNLYIAENKEISGVADLNTEAALKRAGYACIKGSVPGNFELDLEREGVIDEIFFGKNVLKLRQLENRHLWYAVHFNYEPTDTADTFLCFGGIDTFSEIYLNGKRLAETDNMLIGYEFKTDGLLKTGENELVVHIKPTAIEARRYPAGAGAFYHNKYNAESLCVRKAPHMFGWDIMPRALSGGIWRSVTLIKKPADRIEEIYLYPYKVSKESAALSGYYSVTAAGDFIGEYTLKIKGECGSSVFEINHDMWSAYGSLDIQVPNPELWWTKGRGEPKLYEVTAELYRGEKLCDRKRFRLGIRSVELIRTGFIDENGSGDFRFKLNGEDVFFCGTNWVPLDAFHSRDKERLPKALELLGDVGCNMVRCWGGNVYESREFYDYCDENGIAVWQDFAMACASYPRTKEFSERLYNEAESVIKALRQHPSILIWSGDNECDEAITWKPVTHDPNDNILTRRVLPSAVRNNDPVRYFLPSSPYIDESAVGKPISSLPEAHLWGPRDYYKRPYYADAKTRFASETGYHGCPSPESVKKFISRDKLWPPTDNDEWIVHASSPETSDGPYVYRIGLMERQVELLFGMKADNLEKFAAASQISQAEAFKFFIERFRYRKPEASGIIWWNLLDGWPQFSDAVVDYYYDRKPAYFAIRRSQSQLCLMCREPDENGEITLCAVSDLREDAEISYTVEELTSGEITASGKITTKADCVTDIAKLNGKGKAFAFYLIKWESSNASGINHYIFGKPPYDYKTVKTCFERIGLLNK